MASFNRVVLLGNVTRDLELKYIQSGMAVTEVGLAVNDRRKTSSGEWVDETTFVDITLWGRTAEVACEYLKKGSSVLIEGRLKLDTWQNPEGKKQSKLRVVGERMQMVGGRGDGPRGEGSRGDEGRGGADDFDGPPARPARGGYSGRGGSSTRGGDGDSARGYEGGRGANQRGAPADSGYGGFDDGPGGPPVDDDIPF